MLPLESQAAANVFKRNNIRKDFFHECTNECLVPLAESQAAASAKMIEKCDFSVQSEYIILDKKSTILL